MQEKTLETAPCSGFAKSFISGEPIPDATITVLEDESLSFKTNDKGQFGPFDWPVGQPLTLVLNAPGYKTTQTATMMVPKEGLNSANHFKNISFQVPSIFAFNLLEFAMSGDENEKEDPEKCQIAATITPPGITMDDIPQGIEGVTACLLPDPGARVFYFDIFPLIHKTNPFVRDLRATSLDGGVAFLNVPPGDYTMEAKKEGMTFSKIFIKARKGIVVNASPPNGPVMQTGKLSSAQSQPTFFKAMAAEEVSCTPFLHLT